MTQHIHEGAARYQHGNNSPAPSATQALANPQQLLTEHIDLWTSAVRHKSTAGRGSNRKIELAGINKLRELILELAVRGKLVPQNPDDEPAVELLQRIEAEKAQLMKDGNLKKQKPLPAVTDEEKPFELPDGWEWVKLGNIAQINPRNYVDDDTQVSFIPMASVSTSYSGVHEQEIKNWSEVKTGFTHFADGDVAIAKITPCFENSKAAIFSNLRNGVGAGTTELHVARPYGFLAQRFILLVFKSPRYLTEGESQMTGSAGQKRVPKSYFEGTPIQLPPLAEQQRIVAKVDELMTLCDQLEQQSEHQLDAHQQLTETLLSALLTPAAGALTNATSAQELGDNWQRLAQHFDLLFSGPMGAWAIDRLKDTILQLAVMGKLVPQNPDDEPAAELLKRIDAEKARLVKEGKIKKQKPLPPVSDNEKPFELSQGWEWVRLGDALEVINGRAYKKHEMLDTGTPLLRVGNLFTSNEWYYSNLELEPNKYIDHGDLIYAWSASFGPFIWEGGKVIYHYHIWKLEIFDETSLFKPFIYNYLKAITEQIKASGNGIAMLHMTKERMEQLFIPLPPLAEQHRIVAKVDELFALCDQLKERLQHASDTQLNLTDAIVEQALN